MSPVVSISVEREDQSSGDDVQDEDCFGNSDADKYSLSAKLNAFDFSPDEEDEEHQQQDYDEDQSFQAKLKSLDEMLQLSRSFQSSIDMLSQNLPAHSEKSSNDARRDTESIMSGDSYKSQKQHRQFYSEFAFSRSSHSNAEAQVSADRPKGNLNESDLKRLMMHSNASDNKILSYNATITSKPYYHSAFSRDYNKHKLSESEIDVQHLNRNYSEFVEKLDAEPQEMHLNLLKESKDSLLTREPSTEAAWSNGDSTYFPKPPQWRPGVSAFESDPEVVLFNSFKSNTKAAGECQNNYYMNSIRSVTQSSATAAAPPPPTTTTTTKLKSYLEQLKIADSPIKNGVEEADESFCEENACTWQNNSDGYHTNYNNRHETEKQRDVSAVSFLKEDISHNSVLVVSEQKETHCSSQEERFREIREQKPASSRQLSSAVDYGDYVKRRQHIAAAAAAAVEPSRSHYRTSPLVYQKLDRIKSHAHFMQNAEFDSVLDSEYLKVMHRKLQKELKSNFSTTSNGNSNSSRSNSSRSDNMTAASNPIAWDIPLDGRRASFEEQNTRKRLECAQSSAPQSDSLLSSSEMSFDGSSAIAGLSISNNEKARMLHDRAPLTTTAPNVMLKDVPMHELVKKLQQEFEREATDEDSFILPDELNVILNRIKDDESSSSSSSCMSAAAAAAMAAAAVSDETAANELEILPSDQARKEKLESFKKLIFNPVTILVDKQTAQSNSSNAAPFSSQPRRNAKQNPITTLEQRSEVVNKATSCRGNSLRDETVALEKTTKKQITQRSVGEAAQRFRSDLSSNVESLRNQKQKHQKRLFILEKLTQLEKLQAQKLSKLMSLQGEHDNESLILRDSARIQNDSDKNAKNLLKLFDDNDDRQQQAFAYKDNHSSCDPVCNRTRTIKNKQVPKYDQSLQNGLNYDNNSSRFSYKTYTNTEASQFKAVAQGKSETRCEISRPLSPSHLSTAERTTGLASNSNKSTVDTLHKTPKSNSELKKYDAEHFETQSNDLQEAFARHKRDLIMRSEQRQQQIELRSRLRSERRSSVDLAQSALVLSNDKKKICPHTTKILGGQVSEEQRKKCDANALYAKQSTLLKSAKANQAAVASFTVEDIRRKSKNRYKTLPEVQQKELKKSLDEFKRLNRLKSQVFRKKIQQRVLQFGANFDQNFKALENQR